jgi:hypothetical protein
MSVRIETQMSVEGKPVVLQASVGEGQWETPSAELKWRLSLLRLPAGHYPDRDYSLARMAVGIFGGRVLDAPPRFGSTGKIDEGPGESEDKKVLKGKEDGTTTDQ